MNNKNIEKKYFFQPVRGGDRPHRPLYGSATVMMMMMMIVISCNYEYTTTFQLTSRAAVLSLARRSRSNVRSAIFVFC